MVKFHAGDRHLSPLCAAMRCVTLSACDRTVRHVLDVDREIGVLVIEYVVHHWPNNLDCRPAVVWPALLGDGHAADGLADGEGCGRGWPLWWPAWAIAAEGGLFQDEGI